MLDGVEVDVRKVTYGVILLVAFLAFLMPGLITQADDEQWIRGTVVDSHGDAVPGAEVSLRVPHGACTVIPAEHARNRTVTDEDGRYTIAAPPGEMEVYVRHSAYAPGWTGAKDGAEITLHEPSWIEGSIDAPATMTVARGWWRFAEERIDGQFRVGPLPHGVALSVLVESPSHKPQVSHIRLFHAETREMEISLDSGAEVKGGVFPPHEGATIRAHGRDGREFTFTTEADGKFVVAGLEAGWVRLVVTSPNRPLQIIDTSTGETVEVRWTR